MRYCFKCPICGSTGEYNRREPAPRCFGDAIDGHDVEMRRDWRAENSNVWTFTNALGEGKVQAKVVGEGGASDHMPTRGVGEA